MGHYLNMLWLSALLGILAGSISGLIPGVGNFVLMLLLYPFLGSLSINELIIFYSSMATISQYVGSVPATIYGIPGESSSYPTVLESSKLSTVKQVSNAISGSAFGSFVGGIVVLLVCYLLVDYLELLKYMYSTKLLTLLLVLACVAICLSSGDKLITSVLLLVTGFCLSSIGYNSHYSTSILTFNNMYLYAGLPFEVVLISLFAIPQILQNWNTKSKISNLAYNIGTIYIINPIYTGFYTVLGFICGLVPGVTTILSSIAAYNISSYFTKDPVKRIIASETANNAGAFSLLLPLLLFGVPIIASEALLLNLIEQKGFVISSFDLRGLVTLLSINLLLVNVIGLFIAWPLSKYVKYFYTFNLNIVFTIFIVLLVAVVFYNGYLNYSLSYNIIVFTILLPIGYVLRKVNTLPLIFAFIVNDKLIDNLLRLPHII